MAQYWPRRAGITGEAVFSISRFGPNLEWMTLQENRRWAVILAGGSGTRLQSLTRRMFGEGPSGEARPKQFCTLFGNHTLLGHTRARVASVVSLERTTFVVMKAHAPYFGQDFGGCRAQPDPCSARGSRNHGSHRTLPGADCRRRSGRRCRVLPRRPLLRGRRRLQERSRNRLPSGGIMRRPSPALGSPTGTSRGRIRLDRAGRSCPQVCCHGTCCDRTCCDRTG